MELNKNKYSQKEVVDILNAYKSEYEKRIVEQREIIKKLNEEIKELYAREESVNDKEKLVLMHFEDIKIYELAKEEGFKVATID